MNDLITHYMDSIMHIYNPAKLLMGVVKLTFISECVKDERREQLSCNSLSREGVVFILTLCVHIEARCLQPP